MRQGKGFFYMLSGHLLSFFRFIGSYFYDSPGLPKGSEELPPDDVEEEEPHLSRPVEELEQIIGRWVEERHYTDPNLSVEQTLKQLQIPSSELYYYLNSVLHINGFRQWLPGLRVEEAKRLMLEKPYYTFDAIAEACGYSNRSTFSRSFKATEGISPREWVQKATSSSQEKKEILKENQ